MNTDSKVDIGIVRSAVVVAISLLLAVQFMYFAGVAHDQDRNGNWPKNASAGGWTVIVDYINADVSSVNSGPITEVENCGLLNQTCEPAAYGGVPIQSETGTVTTQGMTLSNVQMSHNTTYNYGPLQPGPELYNTDFALRQYNNMRIDGQSYHFLMTAKHLSSPRLEIHHSEVAGHAVVGAATFLNVSSPHFHVWTDTPWNDNLVGCTNVNKLTVDDLTEKQQRLRAPQTLTLTD
ncbi:MAG: hypothetical protein SXQ77_11915, partial [Halobacteria archaeon]|nr:hypothetical protein [Halobacteria archaeon]